MLACGLWLIGCTCWVLGYLYPNIHNAPPQLTNIWRASLILLLNYILLVCKRQSIDVPH